MIVIPFLFEQWCVVQRERVNESNNPLWARGRRRREKSCKVSVGLLLATLAPAPNVLNISLRNIFPNLLVAILRQLKILRSLLFARGGGGGAFLCIGSQPERKSLLLQITNSLSYSALALHFCQRWKDLHLTHHPLANCVCKGCENGLWPFVVCGWGLLRPSIC